MMASITLKSIPNELHRTIKLMQFELEDKGEKKTLEELYIMLLKEGVEKLQNEKPAK